MGLFLCSERLLQNLTIPEKGFLWEPFSVFMRNTI